MLQEHHMNQNGMQRNPRIGMQQMGPPPNQRPPIMMSMPATGVQGVLVSMPPGSGPTLITPTSIPQQPQPQPKPLQPQVYHYEAMPSHQTQNTQQQNEPDHQQLSSSNHNQEQQMSQQSPNSNSSGQNLPLANIKEKTPMCLVNELAKYNKIQHQYRLTGEQGPAHKKIFTVTLKLGKEEYEAEGPSIKKAQHSAAAKALTKTEFKHPPPKTIINRPGIRQHTLGMVTPTVELNALAMKRGERAIYVVEGGAPPHQGYIVNQPAFFPRYSFNYPQAQPRYGFDSRRNVRSGYPYDNRYYGQYRQGPPHHNQSDPYIVRLRVGDREYPGHGATVQAARHDAASKAIDHIKQLGGIDTTDNPCENGHITESQSSPNDVNSELKSPISLVYEIALKRNMNVTFEVLSEKGPPHMKVFVTQCRVGNFLAEGEGNGKKVSKKRAAEKMLEELSKLPPIPNMCNITQLKRKRVTNKKKTRNLIKVNVDKPTEATEEINPISRLIQIQQANKEREPVYTVLEERGAPRRREFVIEASVNGHSCTGVGPNKKVAKRNAAEALLTELGYSSTPTPKSPQQKIEKDNQQDTQNDKSRKVTFVEEKHETQPTQNIGGSGGRQLVPGVLLVSEQNSGFAKPKTDNIEPLKQVVQPAPLKNPPPGVRSKDQLMYLAQLMNIQVHFSDFPKANHEMYLTLVSLGTNPPQVCHGEGSTTEASHEKAALEALKVLSELGLDIAASKENQQNKE
ncbi:double-stranded RNA-binding protein Staufen homolog 2-like isoform X2 [Anthonomus grandis grandis]|uniref:double-stranded RNA-binding protein Staufen homolog 2-like isoform X2 n=1 Tax=Anthonomus grandis grandis TaxID=2921223 RepID=UPI0021665050|nr:double-stranded RNA-binding protein Staufen homolog 2-like isoform X2 [Anthonomus grandis grandis]